MNIRDYLVRRPLLFDGAMGTYYLQVAENPAESCELANLEDPETVLRIHREYIDAGCGAVKTNTFQANEAALGDPETAARVLTRGYELARRAAEGTETFVFADIGPIPRSEREDLEEQYRTQIDLFLNLGAEHFLFETFSDGEYLSELAAYIKERRPEAFVLVSFAVSPEGFTREGVPGERLFREFSADPNVDAAGFNCLSGPFHLLQYIRRLDLTGKTVSVMPNAGYPTVVNNRTFYGNNAGYFAVQIKEIVRQGARIVGGCCGTTPEYISKIARRLEGADRDSLWASAGPPPERRRADGEGEKAPNRLLDKLERGERVVAVELDPPMDTNVGYFMEGARLLSQAGADAITIADCPIARARVDSSLLACKLKRDLGVEPLPHLTCRDRNINATKALMLGLSIEGVRNVLIVTGDPVPSAARNEVKSVYNFNSVMLADYIRTLNGDGTFGNPFHICAALNVNALNFNLQLRKAQKKAEHGVATFLTQPVLSRAAMENLKQARAELDAHILGGIIPIVSQRNACFMNSEVSGITVSEGLLRAYEGVSKERAEELAVSVSSAVAAEIAPYVDGYYLITPFKRVDLICRILHNIRTGAAPELNVLELL